MLTVACRPAFNGFVENKDNILKFKYELGTLTATLRLGLTLVVAYGCYYVFDNYDIENFTDFDANALKYYMLAVAGTGFCIFVFINTFGALIANGRPNRDVILTATHICSPANVTSRKIIEIALADIKNIESIEDNDYAFLRRIFGQSNHKRLVIMSDGKKLTIKSEGLKDEGAYDKLFENLVARLPAR